MYQFNSRVRYSETDEEGKLTMTGIINYLQDTSTFQSEDLGIGISYLKKVKKAWFLSSWRILVDRYPVLGEEITVSTWPYAFKGIYGLRNFAIQDKAGNYLVQADSTWFLCDIATGLPMRVTREDVGPYGEEEPALEMGKTERKIKLPQEFTEGTPVIVSRHHLDTNHHVNNAQYAAIAKEALPEEFQVGELRVEYKKAAVLGDEMIPRVTKTDEGYITALCGAEGQIYAVVSMKGMAAG